MNKMKVTVKDYLFDMTNVQNLVKLSYIKDSYAVKVS